MPKIYYPFKVSGSFEMIFQICINVGDYLADANPLVPPPPPSQLTYPFGAAYKLHDFSLDTGGGKSKFLVTFYYCISTRTKCLLNTTDMPALYTTYMRVRGGGRRGFNT